MHDNISGVFLIFYFFFGEGGGGKVVCFLVLNIPVVCSSGKKGDGPNSASFCRTTYRACANPSSYQSHSHFHPYGSLTGQAQPAPKSHGASTCQKQPLTCRENATLSEQLATAAA